MTATIIGSRNHWEMAGPKRATMEQAQVDAALFPKGAKVTAERVHDGVAPYFQVTADGWLKPNKATGAKNEAAIARYRMVVRTASEIVWDGQMSGFATREDFEAYLSA